MPALAAPVAAPQEPAGWQYRRIDKDEGPSIWIACDEQSFNVRGESRHYETRELYTHPAAAQPVTDAECLAALNAESDGPWGNDDVAEMRRVLEAFLASRGQA
jgi:hypothetical protein